MSVCVYICVYIYIYIYVCVCVGVGVCVCLSSHACVFLCMRVFVCVCMRSRVCVCMHLDIDVCVYLYACMLPLNCCDCIGQSSPLSSVRLRMQSSRCSADSDFLRWLTAVHMNNNICSAFIYLPNNFRYCTLTEMRSLFCIFEFLKNAVERMNERILQLISSPRKLNGNTRGCVFPAVDGN